MKKILVLMVFIVISSILIPIGTLGSTNSQMTPLPTIAKQEPSEIKVLISKTGKIEQMTVSDYLFGVLAGEMPALYEIEALKAQVVASNTFLKWRQKENSDKDYDITDDYTTDQCYLSVEEIKDKWGSKYEEYEAKIKGAIEEVENQTITYDGEIILAVYHSISSGKTEKAKDVWGKDYPYLQSVDSSADRDSKNCVSYKEITKEQMGKLFSIGKWPQKPQNIFSDFSRTLSGAVKSVKVDQKELKGTEIRSLLDLKSSNFEVDYKNDKFVVTVYGYGHGVGMSQNGANEMAKKDKTYTEILKHYYKGVEIK